MSIHTVSRMSKLFINNEMFSVHGTYSHHYRSCSFFHWVSAGQVKLKNVGEFVLSEKCKGKTLFLKSQGN